jgi:hypothetical protein
MRSSPLPWKQLAAPLTPRQRTRVGDVARGLLLWQRHLERWPRVDARGLPDATPFVSLYTRGVLRGCFGSHEGDPGERLARAFLRALEDVRFGGIGEAERPLLAAQVSYLRGARRAHVESLTSELEPGADGLGVAGGDAPPVLLLPQVARDGGMGPKEMVAALARKTGTTEDALRSRTLYLLRSEDVPVHAHAAPHAGIRPRDAAAAWLAGLVASDGEIAFAIDPRRGTRAQRGAMHHGRSAVVLRALASHRGSSRAAARARRWLDHEIARAASGRTVPAWPSDAAMVAGTFALASLAGLDVARELAACASWPELVASPWHAAQVVAAMGRAAPEALFRACVLDLDARPWAPWTAIAAHARGDAVVLARTARALADRVRPRAPHAGGCDTTAVPEVALTALAAEALRLAPGREARAALERARSFLLRWQLVPPRIPAALDPELASGAFPASPVADLLRADVTAHALLALG